MAEWNNKLNAVGEPPFLEMLTPNVLSLLDQIDALEARVEAYEKQDVHEAMDCHKMNEDLEAKVDCYETCLSHIAYAPGEESDFMTWMEFDQRTLAGIVDDHARIAREALARWERSDSVTREGKK